MATLPELVATPIDFVLKGNTYSVKPLTILEIAEATSEMSRTEAERGKIYSDTHGMVYLFFLSMRKTYPEVTLEYVAELLSGEKAEDLADVVNKIGGLVPKVLTGEESSPTLPVPPDGDQTTSDS